MSTNLREELDALAHTQTFSPDPTAWDRGRRARRNARTIRGAAVLAVVALVVGIGAIAVRPDRESPQPADVPGGALPSRIPEPEGPQVTDLAFGQASVAYVDDLGQPVLVSATTGEARHVELPDFPDAYESELRRWFYGPWLALSPDGRYLAYPAGVGVVRNQGVTTVSMGWYRVVDLGTGEARLVEPPPSTGTPRGVAWTEDGQLALDLYGRPTFRRPTPVLERVLLDPATGDSSTSSLTGVAAPGGGISAPYPTDDEPVSAISFEAVNGTDPARELPADLYPDRTAVMPIGWADSSLLVARVADDLVLLTSPDRPESEWTWRVLVSDLPEASGTSVAVDLVPDLTGAPDQELTHDFGN